MSKALFVTEEVPDMFPYKIQDVDAFYHRDHPENLHPDTMKYRRYWLDTQLRRSIEGLWVKDNDTWVYMPPKLYWYVNVGLIRQEVKGKKTWRTIPPDLRDVDWIIFTYMLCCQGFSGFENDDKYTCNDMVKKLLDGEEMFEYEMNLIGEDCYVPGTNKTQLKEYVPAWEYLTRTYLIDDKREKPLGLPLYKNKTYNFVVLSARGVGKSKSMAVGDLMHEFVTNGVKRWEDRKGINDNTLTFFVGSPDIKKLQKFLNDAKNFWNKMPGSYGSGKSYRNGALYRKLSGSWSYSGNDLVHEYEGENGEMKGSGSSIEKKVYSTENPHAAVGDRYIRMYCEEFGLAHNALEIHGHNKESLGIGASKTGMAVYLGTSGDIKKVQQPKKIFEKPDIYDVYGIPNIWEAPDKKIGLFIPAYYKFPEFRDPNGNTNITGALKKIMLARQKVLKEAAATSDLDLELMNNPVKPSEMFMSTGSNLLPSGLARAIRADLELSGAFERAPVGWLHFNPDKKKGVEFEPDLTGLTKPITDYHIDHSKVKLQGGVVIFEPPPDEPPPGLYMVVYDNVKDDGGGPSLASIIVYKAFHELDSEPDSMENTIVAEWIGRLDLVDDMHELALKMAMYYGAKIFPETNIPGFVNYMKKKGKYTMLQRYATYAVSNAINETPNKKNVVGFTVKNRDLKFHMITLLKSWLLQPLGRTEDGEQLYNMHRLRSLRGLDEIANFNLEDNFDYVSCLLGLVLWLDDKKLKPVTEGKKNAKKKEINEYFKEIKRRAQVGTVQNPYYAY